MQNLWLDLRHSMRSLIKTPALTATIVLTVGLGIGAATASFSVIHAVLLQPLPYPDADRLVRIYTDSGSNRYSLSVADYLALEEQQTSFTTVAGYDNTAMTFNRGDVAERLVGKYVTASYFPLLGISPLHGRLISEVDDRPGSDPTAVVSHSFWTRYLDGDPNVVGQRIRLDGREHTVVGVLPSEVGPFEQNRAFFVAAQWEPPQRKGPFFITALARRDSKIHASVASEELRTISRRIFPLWQSSYQDERAAWSTMDLKEYVVGDVGTMLALVLGAVGFVLLIASTNAANLLVARAAQRRKELAMRAALGASRGRLFQHLLSESVLLALGSAGVGLLLMLGLVRALITVGVEYIPRAREIALDGPVFAVFAAVTAASLLLFGLLPALQGANARLDRAFRSATPSPGPRRLRRALVVSQFAIAAPLLIGAGLLIASLVELQRVDLGFDGENVLTVSATLPEAAYPERSDVVAFWDEVLERVEALPGVRSAAFADGRPPNSFMMTNNFDLEDKPTPPGESQPDVPWVSTTPSYFESLGIPLLQGRLFDERDHFDAPPVAVVDQAWARRFFPDEEVLGRRFYSGGCTTCPMFTVIGVVGDVKYTGLDDPGEGTIYWSMAQGTSRFRYLVARTEADAAGLLPSIRAVVREIDPGLPLTRAATIDELVRASLETPRYLSVLTGGFAAVALLLSVIGIYGVVSHFVQQHTRDIGIRIALGGRPSMVLRMVLSQGMQLVALGVVVGVGASFGLTRYMSSLLFGVGATDLETFVIVSAVMLSVALFACYIPARRAAGVDPATTLRDE